MKAMLSRFVLVSLTMALLAVVPASAADYSIDGVHSSALFKVKHFGVSNFYGAFKDISGKISYDAENPGASKIEVSIAAGSVDTRMEQRDGHLKSPDFLNAAEFPTITFKSTSVEGSGDSLQVKGNLTLHGVTKEITATVAKTGEGKNPRSGKDMVGFETRFTVDRTEFDMGFMAGPVGKDVEFLLSVEAAR